MEHRRIPNRLQRYRRYFNLSQKEVASLLGLPDASPLSRWEKGHSVPSITHLFRLSRIYKTLPQELYSELWHTLSEEIKTAEAHLLAQKESLKSNEVFFI